MKNLFIKGYEEVCSQVPQLTTFSKVLGVIGVIILGVIVFVSFMWFTTHGDP